MRTSLLTKRLNWRRYRYHYSQLSPPLSIAYCIFFFSQQTADNREKKTQNYIDSIHNVWTVIWTLFDNVILSTTKKFCCCVFNSPTFYHTHNLVQWKAVASLILSSMKRSSPIMGSIILGRSSQSNNRLDKLRTQPEDINSSG